MTKNEFVKVLSKKANLPQEQTKALLNATLESIVEVVKSGEKLLFSDFGTFYISNRAQRKGRNPQTGKPITIPAFRLPAFRVGSTFKKAVNELPKKEEKQTKQTNAKNKKK
ncbi:MAG: HU family DNA-binding protein [Desulfurella sp.]|jgi:DNA-binding protein HU-beta|uniref:HU family DNA-binding protein n=1 Tax=Desulfurella sp. TaxID=1962857 RepID=UPI003D125168